MNDSASWRVLLLGGCSGTGKTRAAREFGRRLGVPCLMVDDLRMAIQQVTTPDNLPDLHTFLLPAGQSPQTPEEICHGLFGVAHAMAPALEMVIAHHLAVDGVGPILLEGDGILPTLITQPRLEPLRAAGPAVRAVFLHEPDQATLLANALARGRGFQNLTPEEQRRWTHGHWLYGNWLAEQAREHNQSLVPARPFGTLTDRILQAVRDKPSAA